MSIISSKLTVTDCFPTAMAAPNHMWLVSSVPMRFSVKIFYDYLLGIVWNAK